MRPNPMWLKAPLLLLRWPPILAAIGVGITVLVVSMSVAPLFLSSAASGALEDGLRDLPPASAGLTLGQQTPFVPLMVQRPGARPRRVSPLELHQLRDRELELATRWLGNLEPQLATVGTGVSVLRSGAEQTRVQPLAREGFIDHIEVEESVEGEGVWLARSAADLLGAAAGKELELDIDGPTEVRIKGIYSDLAAEPVTPYWVPVDQLIHAARPANPIPPPPLLMDIPTLLGLGAATESTGFESWEFALDPEGLTLDEGSALARQLSAVSQRALDNDTQLGSVFNEPFLNTTLPVVVDSAADTVAGVQSPVQVLALIGGLVALVLIVVSAHYVVEKRSIEFRLLVARGVGHGWVAARSIVEASVVGAFFGALGTVVTFALVRAFGPGPIDATAIRQAILLASASVLFAVVAQGTATANAARKKTAVEHAGASHDTGWPWEVVLLVIAGLAFYLIESRGAIETGSREGGRVDILLVLFPLLGISGAALFLLRLGFSFLNRARAATERAGTSLFLAARRLAAASRSVMLFVGAAAVSVGMLVYSTGLVSSVRATTYAKTHVFVGSDVSVFVSEEEPLDLGFDYTYVAKIDGDVGERSVEIMGIDPEPFADTAYWDADFADDDLDSLVDRLDEPSTGSLPVIIAGDDDFAPSSFSVFGHEAPMTIVGRADTWPGMKKDTPMIVAAKPLLTETASEAGFSMASGERLLWVEGPPNDVLRALQEADVDTNVSVSARDASRSSALLSISWTFGLLRILGIVVGFMSILGMLLYVASRHRARLVSYLLGRRMGLRVKEHRTALLMELLAMLLISLTLGGALGLVATWLIYTSLDLLPTVPPAPLFRIPGVEVAAALIVFVAAALLGSRLIQGASDRARAGEVMRLAD